MERGSGASLRSLITALAVVLAIAAIWVAAALASGSSGTGSSTTPAGPLADLVQSGEDDDGLFDDDDDFFRGGGRGLFGDEGAGGLFDDEDCPFGEDGPRGNVDPGDQGQPDADPDAVAPADL